MQGPPYKQNSLESAGYVYDMWKTDNVFGQSAGFNIDAAKQSNSAEMTMGDGVAIPSQDKAAFDKPENLTGLSRRQFHERTTRQDVQELNYVYLGAFALALAFAFW